MLFGCTEDIVCSDRAHHAKECEATPFVRQLYINCLVPVCEDCVSKMYWHSPHSSYRDGGTIPMSLSNDHYYGHVNRFIVENQVTWLECAASCMIWSTMLVYYLEAPYGHLMAEVMGSPQARTKVKGNLFSFTMPWEDIERCCHLVCLHAKELHKTELSKLQQEMGVPHTEETLALLVNVHFVGGSKDLTQHLRGLTLRVHVIQRLIDILRASGYPGYEPDGINSADKVARRLHDRYRQRYGDATFTPAAVLEAARVHKNTALSLVQDKVATPPEALQSIEGWQRTTRPSHIVAERSVQSQSNIHENYAAVFGKYGDFNITTASTMTKQFVPWYLGMAFPFTMPSAVGGYDVPDHPRWRRPEDEDLPFPRACMDVWTQTPKAYVFLIFCSKNVPTRQKHYAPGNE